MKRNEVVYNIPGGWYGADPGQLSGIIGGDPKRGHVVVDEKCIDEALRWLLSRATIVQVRVGDRSDVDGSIAVAIDYTLKPSRRELAVDKAIHAILG